MDLFQVKEIRAHNFTTCPCLYPLRAHTIYVYIYNNNYIYIYLRSLHSSTVHDWSSRRDDSQTQRDPPRIFGDILWFLITGQETK